LVSCENTRAVCPPHTVYLLYSLKGGYEDYKTYARYFSAVRVIIKVSTTGIIKQDKQILKQGIHERETSSTC
jgi:hypothetical protein